MATLRRDHHRHEAGPAGRPRHRWPGTWREVLPGVDAARHYRGAWLRRDVLAGATVTAYLIPQVMAYAEVAGLPAVTGLWAIIGPLLVYALLGSSTSLSVGPESTTALMTAAMVAPLAGGAIGSGYPRLAMLTAIVVGLVCLLGWLARQAATESSPRDWAPVASASTTTATTRSPISTGSPSTCLLYTSPSPRD